MNYRMGMDVIGPEGKVGELSRVVVDPEKDTIVGLVVKNGMVNTAEYVIAVEDVRAATDSGDLAVDFNEAALKGQPLFDPGRYGTPDPDYTGPPGFDASTLGMENMALDTYVAMGPLVGFSGGGTPVLGYPGGESQRPEELPWATLADGSDVFDVSGEKVGELESVSMDSESGRPSGITVRRGWLFKKHVNVPAAWIRDIGDGRVVLDKPKEELGRLAG